jgi:hypothetical protein
MNPASSALVEGADRSYMFSLDPGQPAWARPAS